MKKFVSSFLAVCMMFSISSVAVHAEEADPVNNQKTATPTIISQSAKIPLPSDNPNIKKYQVTTSYSTGIRVVDTMIDERMSVEKNNKVVETTLATTNSYNHQVRLETDRNVYSGSTLLAYVRSVGNFQYSPGVTGAITVHDTYGSSVTSKSSSVKSYTCKRSVEYKQYHSYAYVHVDYTLSGNGTVFNGTDFGRVTIGCDIYGNRL
ncbi:MAG: hypothetical protein E7572_13470 [Ruminococcaceae bacterium]|nr:hypothetical protein [Oscillospiraceae bacterium]